MKISKEMIQEIADSNYEVNNYVFFQEDGDPPEDLRDDEDARRFRRDRHGLQEGSRLRKAAGRSRRGREEGNRCRSPQGKERLLRRHAPLRTVAPPSIPPTTTMEILPFLA